MSNTNNGVNLKTTLNVDTSTQVSLPNREDETMVAIRKLDWVRIKRTAERIRPVVQWWSVFASIFAGAMFSCGVNWIVAYRGGGMTAKALTANGYLTLMFLGFTIMCLIAEMQTKGNTQRDANDLIEEITTVERGYPEIFAPPTN